MPDPSDLSQDGDEPEQGSELPPTAADSNTGREEASVEASVIARRATGSHPVPSLLDEESQRIQNEHGNIENAHLVRNLELKGPFAWILAVTMVLQLVVIDGVFIAYAWAGKHWDIPTGAIQAWLAATIVQLIAVFRIIIVSLFPEQKNENKRDKSDEDE